MFMGQLSPVAELLTKLQRHRHPLRTLDASELNSSCLLYLFWWCYIAHRAAVCCLLQCPAAVPCSCLVHTPHPAYWCPGTAGNKTHSINCNSTACAPAQVMLAWQIGHSQLSRFSLTPLKKFQWHFLALGCLGSTERLPPQLRSFDRKPGKLHSWAWA